MKHLTESLSPGSLKGLAIYPLVLLGLPSPEAESGESEPVHAACLENALGGRGRREA